MIYTTYNEEINFQQVTEKLFTGPQIGNTYQKGINWIGDFPNLDLVIVRSSQKNMETGG